MPEQLPLVRGSKERREDKTIPGMGRSCQERYEQAIAYAIKSINRCNETLSMIDEWESNQK